MAITEKQEIHSQVSKPSSSPKKEKSKKNRESVGHHSEGDSEQGSFFVLDGGSSVLSAGLAEGGPTVVIEVHTSQPSLGHTIESVNVEEPYMPTPSVECPTSPSALLLGPTLSVDAPPSEVPTELSVHQQVALGSLKSFLSSFRRFPPTSLLTARSVSSDLLAFIQDSGYPVRQLETLLQRVFASCSEYADISTKSPVEVVRESCARRLKEAVDTLAVPRDRADRLEMRQVVTLSSLESVETEHVTISKEAGELEELRRQLETTNKGAVELSAQLPLLQLTVVAQRRALQDKSTNMNQLILKSAPDGAGALQDDVAFCVTAHASLLRDAAARARADLEELLSSFP